MPGRSPSDDITIAAPEYEGAYLNDDAAKTTGLSKGFVAQIVLTIVVVVAVFLYVLPRIVDYGDVWASIEAMTWLEVLTLVMLAVWNQTTYVLVEMAGRPGLGYRQAMKITMTSTAIANTLPAGAAFGAGSQVAMYVSYGFDPRDIGISMASTGIWNTFTKLAMPVVALGLLVLDGNAGGPLVVASLMGLLVLVVAVIAFTSVLRSERGAHAVGRRLGAALSYLGRLVRRPSTRDWSAALTDFRRRAIQLLKSQWARLTLTTLVSHITLYVVLLVALRHVGIGNDVVSWQEALAAFAFVRLLSALPITPGGLGVVELGLTASLVAAGGDEARVVAAILIYRLLTFVIPIPLGSVSYLFWRHEVGRSKRLA